MAGLDLKSFRALFDRQYLKVCHYIQVKSSCDWSHCESIARKAFVNLWKGRENLAKDCSALSYLLEIVRQELYADFGIPNSISSNNSGMLEFASVDPEIKRLKWAVNQLDPELREVFMLRKQKDYSIQEIAEILDTSIQSIEEHLHKALVELRRLLFDTGAADQPAYRKLSQTRSII